MKAVDNMKLVMNKKSIFVLIILIVIFFSLNFLKVEDKQKEDRIIKSIRLYIDTIENNISSSNKDISGYYNITTNGIKKDNEKEVVIKLKGIKPISGKIKIGKNGKVISSNFILNNYFVNVKEDNIHIKKISINIYSNKIMSVLGDSISTYKDYIPDINGYAYSREKWLTDVNLTWWYRVINNFNMNLGVNESWAGSRVFSTGINNYSCFGPDRHMASMTRLNNLDDNGVPDVIFFYGGTNDIGNLINLVEFDSNAEYATGRVDLTKTAYSSFTEAYTLAIRRMKYLYPHAELIVLLPLNTKTYYTNEELNDYTRVIKKICDYYNVFYIDLSLSGINESNLSTYLIDGIHPNEKGMYLIARYIESEIKRNFYSDKIFGKYMIKAK